MGDDGRSCVERHRLPWFDVKRPAALSIAYNGSSLGGVALTPLWVLLIGAFGFLEAALVVGGLMLVVIAVICRRYLSTTPAAMGLHPYGAATGAAPAPSSGAVGPRIALSRNRAFLTLALAMAFGLFAQIGLIAHLFTVLTGPLGAQMAGVLMGAATFAALVGRTLTGFLLPATMDRRFAASASYLVQMAGAGFLMLSGGTDIPFLVGGVLLFGVGIGNATSLPPLIAQQEFPKAEVQRVVSLIVASAQTAYAFAPAAFAAVQALTVASPLPFFVVAALAQGLAIACLMLGRSR